MQYTIMQCESNNTRQDKNVNHTRWKGSIVIDGTQLCCCAPFTILQVLLTERQVTLYPLQKSCRIRVAWLQRNRQVSNLIMIEALGCQTRSLFTLSESVRSSRCPIFDGHRRMQVFVKATLGTLRAHHGCAMSSPC